jgi:amidohydrolase
MTLIDYQAEVAALAGELVATRRDLHRHPELGFQEVRTAGIVARRLNELGIEAQSGVGKTGVVGVLDGARPGPVVMLRADMDALPVTEANDVEYASQTAGVMHACGHDGHTAMLLGLARLLAAHRTELAGTIKFVFQPAEEGMGGAEAMIRDGVLDGPHPDVALGMHLWNPLPVGQVGVVAGPEMAAAEILRITLSGRGGHGASPHETADPVVGAAQVITALQSIVARNVSPLEPAVISITSVHGGTAFNIIPADVELTGTIRTFQPRVREMVLARVRQVIASVAEGMGLQAAVEIQALTPAVINDPQVTTAVRAAAADVLGADNVLAAQTLGSEDMACFLNAVPGCFFFVGSANPARDLHYPHHSERFDFDERALSIGLEVMYRTVGRYVLV